jgi:hypothetical protein
MPGAGPSPVTGIVHTIINPGHLDKIGGLSYHACEGYEHPLDGQGIDFGVPGISRDQVPSPWRELIEPQAQPFTFTLDSPEQHQIEAP